jgi:hypothetical protein
MYFKPLFQRQKANNWRSVDKCEGLIIETLMWTKQGRAFSGVGYVWKRGEVIIHADMFPNTKFGYNGREFLISTLHVNVEIFNIYLYLNM